MNTKKGLRFSSLILMILMMAVIIHLTSTTVYAADLGSYTMPFRDGTVSFNWRYDPDHDLEDNRLYRALYGMIQKNYINNSKEEKIASYVLDVDGNYDIYCDSTDSDINVWGACEGTNLRGNFILSLNSAVKGFLDSYNYDYYSQITFEFNTYTAVLPAGKTFTYTGSAQTGVASGTGYTLSGTTSASNAGSYTANATLDNGYSWSDGSTSARTISWKINKAANPLTMKAKTASVSYTKLKKKTQTLAVTKVISFTKKISDKKTYTLSSAKKGSKSFKKYFKINKTKGTVTVKKGLKKGTYNVKVKVKASGTSNYKASAGKTVTFKIKVK